MTSSETPRRGIWYYGWTIVLVCVLCQFTVNALTYSTFTLYVQAWSREFSVPVSTLQFAMLGMMVVVAAACPIVGVLVDRFSTKSLLVCGLIGMVAFYFSVSLAARTWQLIALYGILAPIPFSLSNSIPVNALISRWFTRRLGLALGLSAFGLGMAGVLLPPLVAALLPVLGWRMIWRIGAFLILFAVLPLIILVVRQSPTAREGLHYVEDTSRAVPLHKPASLQAVRLRDILMRPNFWLLIGAYVPMLGLNDAVAQNLSPYVASLGWDQRTAAGLLSVLSFSNLLATLLLGIFSDRFGNRVPLLLLTGATATGGVLFALGGGLPVIALACAFIGFAGGINTLMAATLAAEFGAKGFGRAFGMSLFFIPFLPLSAVVTARVKEVSGSYTPAFFVLSVLLVTSFGFSSLFFRQKRNGSPSAAAAMAVLVHPAPPPS